MNEAVYNLAAFLATILLAFTLAVPVNADPGGHDSNKQTFAGNVPTLTTAPDEVPENPQLLSALPVITVWHENSLRFGHIGNPQSQINILGNVQDPDGQVRSLTYRLNGGTSTALSIGPDGLRLANQGDFNVAININSPQLQSGSNTLVLTARDNSNDVQTKTVTFTYTRNRVWPARYSTNWAGASSIFDQAQVVDGFWQLANGGVRPSQIGYDRVIAIGDMSWTNYEVLVPITTHGFYPNPDNPSDSGGVGIIARWTGHTGSASPPSNWWEMGTYAYYSNRLDALAVRLDEVSSNIRTQDFNFQLNRTYMFKLRAQNISGQGVYSFKIWERGQAEPSWNSSSFSNIVNVVDETDTRLNGSILLVAHRADATVGNVTICPPNITYPLTVNTSGSGSVSAVPAKSNYQCGEGVTLTATPASGWTFAGWSGDINASASTISFNMTQAHSITANFRSGQPVELDNQFYIPFVVRD